MSPTRAHVRLLGAIADYKIELITRFDRARISTWCGLAMIGAPSHSSSFRRPPGVR